MLQYYKIVAFCFYAIGVEQNPNLTTTVTTTTNPQTGSATVSGSLGMTWKW